MNHYKTITIRIAVLLVVVMIIITGSIFAYIQLSKPQTTQTRIETDVKTKDIIIKSEKDLSTASNELDSLNIDDDSKTLDDLSNGF